MPLKLSKKIDLQLLRSISWQDIFDAWRDGEAWQESWRRHWEERGFGSWEEWRMHHLRPYHPETLEWSLYRVTDPLATVPDLFGAPTKNWIKGAYEGEMTKRLRDIVHLPIVSENEKIDAVREHFPKKVMLVAISDKDRIILIEGMHRSCAMATWNPALPFQSDVTIAIAPWTESAFRIADSNPKHNQKETIWKKNSRPDSTRRRKKSTRSTCRSKRRGNTSSGRS